MGFPGEPAPRDQQIIHHAQDSSVAKNVRALLSAKKFLNLIGILPNFIYFPCCSVPCRPSSSCRALRQELIILAVPTEAAEQYIPGVYKGVPERFFSYPYGGSYLKRAKRAFGNPYVLPYYGSYYAPRYYYGYRSPYYW
jgi:hypothetical protein